MDLRRKSAKGILSFLVTLFISTKGVCQKFYAGIDLNYSASQSANKNLTVIPIVS
jgi:hypothetical protein